MLVVVLIVLCCALFGVWSWVRPREPSPPVYPGALPLVGHGLLCIGLDPKHFWKFEEKINNFSFQNGGIALIRAALHNVYIITVLEDGLKLANTFFQKSFVFNFLKEVYGRGLLTAETSLWKSHRKLISPTFNQQVLNTYVREHNAQARSLVSQLACEVGKAPFDIQPYLISNVLKTVFTTTFGKNHHDQTIMDYSHATEPILTVYLNRIQNIFFHLQCFFNLSSLKKKHDEFAGIIKRTTNKIINERKSELKLNKGLDIDDDHTQAKFKPLLDYMLLLADKQNAFTDDEIREHLDTIVGAAYDTTTKALTFTLILIGSHQDVQTKLLEELQDVLGQYQDKDVDRHDLPKLVYLEAVIKESLRLLPPVPRIARTCTSSIELNNYTLPAGCTAGIILSHINRHPMWGADADQFKPERWLDPSTLPDNPNAFASFSLGRRNCIGKQYAIMIMKTYLANILRRYRVTADVNKLETRCDLLLTPIGGHHISLELRS